MSRILISLIAMVTMTVAGAAGTFWQKVSDISLSKEARLDSYKGVLYLYDEKSFLLSNDDGQSWTRQEGYVHDGVIAVERVGPLVFAFTQHEAEGRIRVLRADGAGMDWQEVSVIDIGADDKLVGVAVYQSGMYAYTRDRKILASWDNGKSWNHREVDGMIGTAVDMAVGGEVWIVCGTEAAMWSSNSGRTWHQTTAPAEAGSTILSVETIGNTIWAGCRLGASRFECSSRSWNVVNDGIPVFASLVATPLSLRSLNGVLFGIFKTYNGKSTIMRITESGREWTPMESVGLPPHNFTTRENFTLVDKELFLYHHGDDQGFLGVYKHASDAPTSVNDLNAMQAGVVSPLPASTQITIKPMVETPVTGMVVNNLGQVVKTVSVNGPTSVSVAELAVGTYNLLLMDEAQTITTHPLVITR